MKIDCMLIVLNGEPWIEAWLKTYEPHANKVFIIEGTDNEMFHKVPKKIRGQHHTGKGHSVDNTLEIIKAYNSKKIVLINENKQTKNGFWHSKHQMVKQINKLVEGDWVWEADVDEFLHPKHIEIVKKTLAENPKRNLWQFPVYNFWRSASHFLAGGWVTPYRRIFKWEPGKTKWTTHRPPTTNMGGNPGKLRVNLYHYNYILEKDAKYKPLYHGGYGGGWFEKKWLAWNLKTKEQIEKKGIGPASWPRTGTRHIPDVVHPIHVRKILENMIKVGKILP